MVVRNFQTREQRMPATKKPRHEDTAKLELYMPTHGIRAYLCPFHKICGPYCRMFNTQR